MPWGMSLFLSFRTSDLFRTFAVWKQSSICLSLRHKSYFFSQHKTPFCPPVFIPLSPVFRVFVFYNRGKSMVPCLRRPFFMSFRFEHSRRTFASLFERQKVLWKLSTDIWMNIHRCLSKYPQMFEQISTDVWPNILRYFEKGLRDHQHIIY